MRILLLLLLIQSFTYALSQKAYYHFRDTLVGLTCDTTDQFVLAKQNIPILKKYAQEHPDHYQVYYDLGMEYLTLAYKDSVPSDEMNNRSIEYFEKYIATAPKKHWYKGYWNIAIIKYYLKDGDGSLAAFTSYLECCNKRQRKLSKEKNEGFKLQIEKMCKDIKPVD